MIKFQADDFGYCPKNIESTLGLIKQKKIHRVSILTNFLFLQRRKKVLDKMPPVEIGIHINLVEGKPISNKLKVKTLIKENGDFYPWRRQLLRILFKKISTKEIENEVESQIRYYLTQNVHLSFIDSHQHIHAFSPFAEIFQKLASKYKIKKIRGFNNIKTYTFRAKLIKLLLNLFSRLSHFIYFGLFNPPISWHDKNGVKYAFLSWESKNILKKRFNKNEDLIIVIHPGLSYDKADYTKIKLI